MDVSENGHDEESYPTVDLTSPNAVKDAADNRGPCISSSTLPDICLSW